MWYVLNVIISDCTGLKTTWTNMKTDKQFPVSTGTVLSLSCNEGCEFKGDQTVTCTTNTKFQYSVEPACGMYNYEKNFNLIFSSVLTLTYLRYSNFFLMKTSSVFLVHCLILMTYFSFQAATFLVVSLTHYCYYVLKFQNVYVLHWVLITHKFYQVEM